MPPKKAASTATATKKAAVAPSHPPFKDMVKDAIINLKERNGSSRQAIKKYVRANNNVDNAAAGFDRFFNDAITRGVKAGEFEQPKGSSGPVKLAKKAPKEAEKKPVAAPKKETKPKVEKKEVKPKATTTKKVAVPKKTATKATVAKKVAPPKKPEAKAKANSAKPRAKKATTTKTEAPAPAVVDTPAVLKKTKSGRVSKQKVPAKKLNKIATGKKVAAPKKKSTPKKAEAAS